MLLLTFIINLVILDTFQIDRLSGEFVKTRFKYLNIRGNKNILSKSNILVS